ncbi:MAG TPA: RtcB family protein [Dehalococcoidia bacterium]|jgi:tRNA-splicing ligase RtcB|nr:RtcB family protein [Dehalococcoidia bacterium]
MTTWRKVLRRIDDYRWELPADYKPGMRVPARIYADEALLSIVEEEQALEQAANVATLPGIVWRSLAMPDIHWGYGFPIGGVAAMRLDDGVVSPGGVGFDINCGTRLIATNLTEADVRPRLQELVDRLFQEVPAGLGGHGPIRVTDSELDEIMVQGSAWMVERGYGLPEDLEVTESRGRIPGADPACVTTRARQRGHAQLGTLGSGNHFLEVQVLDTVYDREAATRFGLAEPGQVLVFFHCGSRGFGHQICQDYLDVMEAAAARYGIHLPDKQLACAPIRSPEGKRYLAAMAAGANFAWANRQCITHRVRRSFELVFGRSAEALGMRLVYDVAHNIAKIERHRFEGREIEVCVHRKGATRAFPAGHPEVPERYRDVGQPALIPGDMGRYSFVTVGLPRAMEETWGSTCHGAGRVRSRHAAKRLLKGVDIRQRLAKLGIVVRCHNPGALAEEASEAYKDVANVVEVLEKAGISRNVAKLRPIGVIKG